MAKRSDTRKKARRTRKTRKAVKKGGFPKFSFSNPFSTKKVITKEYANNYQKAQQNKLISAVARENEKTVKTLLHDFGVHPNASRYYQGQISETALGRAVQQDNMDIVTILLAKGADPLYPNIKGKRAIDVAKKMTYPNDEMIELLETRIEQLHPNAPKNW